MIRRRKVALTPFYVADIIDLRGNGIARSGLKIGGLSVDDRVAHKTRLVVDV